MQRTVSSIDRDKLGAEVAQLEALGLNELRARWHQLYETAPPPRFSRDLLRRAIAYWMQELVLGGLNPAPRRLLQRVADEARARKPIKLAPMRKLFPWMWAGFAVNAASSPGNVPPSQPDSALHRSRNRVASARKSSSPWSQVCAVRW